MADIILTPRQLTGNVALTELTISHLDNYFVKNDGRTFVMINNTHSQAIQIVINAVGYCDQEELHSVTLTIPATTFIHFGVFNPHWFNQVNGSFIGMVKLNFLGDLTGLTSLIGAYRI